MAMRRIEFPPGTRPTTKERVSTLAWATNRRGRNPWKSRNVTAQVSEYVQAAGYAYDSVDAAAAIKWIVDNKYGFRKHNEGGKRTLEFAFVPDVDLNGHMPAHKLTTERTSIGSGAGHQYAAKTKVMAQAQHEQGVATMQSVVHPEPVLHVDPDLNGNSPPVDIVVPLPGEPERPDLYGLNDFCDLAYAWADINPDGWAAWVDRATESLRAQIH
jgi:hypothetical protein